ncbi:hypothetical protein HPULCUR_008670 [Helicostylum pulchrum]|uniref:Uncharacterized protein n=1 Tax=Helicostylum pulchrum TaxID=562976 RepID=A0ABP9Y893_9FUNG
MPYTRFDKLYIERKRTIIKHCLGMFLKYSNENGDKYFYTDLKSNPKSGFIEFSESSRMGSVREFIINFGRVNIKFLA